MRGFADPVRRLRQTARRPAPVVAFERPPGELLVSLRAAAAEAAAAAGALALLDAAPRPCSLLLGDLAAHQASAETHAREIARLRSAGIDRRWPAHLSTALTDVAIAVHDAARWWCRSGGCVPEVQGLAGALRDATRALSDAIETLPGHDAPELAVNVHRRVSEGRRLARRARAAAVERGELREVLGRMNAIAAVERGLSACGRGATTLQRLAT